MDTEEEEEEEEEEKKETHIGLTFITYALSDNEFQSVS